MNKILKISILTLLSLIFFNTDAAAQKSKSKSKSKSDVYFDESGGFKHRLWYGGGFNLGFNGGNGINTFALGVSPMVGYKIIGGLSAGPRVSFTYTSVKSAFLNPSKLNLTEFSAGPFVRYKFFKNIFIQAEYEFLRSYEEDPNTGSLLIDLNGKLIRQNRENKYVGIGYNSGSLIGYEIGLFYNFDAPIYKQNFDFRFGFTYNF
jgi:hypothetical protein